MQYFTIGEEKNPGYRIIELICYCFLTNLGILFLVHKLNDFILLISEGDEIVRACDRH